MAPTETPTRVQALGYSGVPVASPVFGVLVTPQDEDEMARKMKNGEGLKNQSVRSEK